MSDNGNGNGRTTSPLWDVRVASLYVKALSGSPIVISFQAGIPEEYCLNWVTIDPDTQRMLVSPACPDELLKPLLAVECLHYVSHREVDPFAMLEEWKLLGLETKEPQHVLGYWVLTDRIRHMAYLQRWYAGIRKDVAALWNRLQDETSGTRLAELFAEAPVMLPQHVFQAALALRHEAATARDSLWVANLLAEESANRPPRAEQEILRALAAKGRNTNNWAGILPNLQEPQRLQISQVASDSASPTLIALQELAHQDAAHMRKALTAMSPPRSGWYPAEDGELVTDRALELVVDRRVGVGGDVKVYRSRDAKRPENVFGIVLDASGSTSTHAFFRGKGYILFDIEAYSAMLLAEAIRGLSIPLVVTAFGGETLQVVKDLRQPQLAVESLSAISPRGSTPISQAGLITSRLMASSQAESGVLFILTDAQIEAEEWTFLENLAWRNRGWLRLCLFVFGGRAKGTPPPTINVIHVPRPEELPNIVRSHAVRILKGG